jgi:hypothetical protein
MDGEYTEGEHRVQCANQRYDTSHSHHYAFAIDCHYVGFYIPRNNRTVHGKHLNIPASTGTIPTWNLPQPHPRSSFRRQARLLVLLHDLFHSRRLLGSVSTLVKRSK